MKIRYGNLFALKGSDTVPRKTASEALRLVKMSCKISLAHSKVVMAINYGAIRAP